MYVGATTSPSSIATTRPEDFDWVVLPPLAGTRAPPRRPTRRPCRCRPQSEHVEEAAEFIDFFMAAENLAAVAEGDWLIPASAAARDAVARTTGGENGWDDDPRQRRQPRRPRRSSRRDYPQWKDQIATPAFQQYLADEISLDDLQAQLTDGLGAGRRRLSIPTGTPTGPTADTREPTRATTASGDRQPLDEATRGARRRGRRRRPRRRRPRARPRSRSRSATAATSTASSRRSTPTGATPGRSRRTTRATGTSPTTP